MVRQRSARRLVWRSAGAKGGKHPGLIGGRCRLALTSGHVKARPCRWLIQLPRDRIDLIHRRVRNAAPRGRSAGSRPALPDADRPASPRRSNRGTHSGPSSLPATHLRADRPHQQGPPRKRTGPRPEHRVSPQVNDPWQNAARARTTRSSYRSWRQFPLPPPRPHPGSFWPRT